MVDDLDFGGTPHAAQRGQRLGIDQERGLDGLARQIVRFNEGQLIPV